METPYDVRFRVRVKTKKKIMENKSIMNELVSHRKQVCKYMEEIYFQINFLKVFTRINLRK